MMRSAEYQRGYDAGYKAALEKVATLRAAARQIDEHIVEQRRNKPLVLLGVVGR